MGLDVPVEFSLSKAGMNGGVNVTGRILASEARVSTFVPTGQKKKAGP